MDLLAKQFSKSLRLIGMEEITYPIFYNALHGIQFEIGSEEDVYIEEKEDDLQANPIYIAHAFERVQAIYRSLPDSPNVLRIDGSCEEENEIKEVLETICKLTKLPVPKEQYFKKIFDEEFDSTYIEFQSYWDLSEIDFTIIETVLLEVIKADIGGYHDFASNVFFMNTKCPFLFHLYDDRGADLVARDKELLSNIYEKFSSFILETN